MLHEHSLPTALPLLNHNIFSNKQCVTGSTCNIVLYVVMYWWVGNSADAGTGLKVHHVKDQLTRYHLKASCHKIQSRFDLSWRIKIWTLSDCTSLGFYFEIILLALFFSLFIFLCILSIDFPPFYQPVIIAFFIEFCFASLHYLSFFPPVCQTLNSYPCDFCAVAQKTYFHTSINL